MRRTQVSPRDPWYGVVKTALMLLLLMIAISPVTQSIWKGDNFLHGHDTETTLVLGLTMASVAILRMRSGRIDLDEALRGLGKFLSSLFGTWLLWYLAGLTHCLSQAVPIPHRRGPPGRQSGYQLPLLI